MSGEAKTAEGRLDQVDADIQAMVRDTPESLHHPQRLIWQSHRQREIEIASYRATIEDARIEGAEAMKVANLLAAKPFHRGGCGCGICSARQIVVRDIGKTDAREVVATP